MDRPAILDAINGVLIVNPSEHDIKNCKRNLIKKTGSCVKDSSEDDALLHDVNNESLMTKDGVRVHLFVNISSVKEFIMAKKLDIEGIGLVRTESLFINYKKFPMKKTVRGLSKNGSEHDVQTCYNKDYGYWRRQGAGGFEHK